ncbi:MAG: hypothetical protein HFG33_05780 [Bacilli bacterium]|nr:hypothetical protein [Bacilli bacterium]
MSEITIIIDNWGHEELKEYLMSLKGILDVEIKNVEHEIKSDEQLDIYLKYDSSLITPKIIKMEITLFLNITKIPSILSFDKYPKFKTSNYTIIRDDLCCEYCYKGAIEDLFEIEGIETVKGNFNEDYLFKKYEEREKITINIEYNPNLLKAEDMKQIELKLNI